MSAAQPKPRIGAVLVAAGESQRMGAPNKLALPIAGEPLLRRCAHELLGAKVTEVVVVLGHEADWAREALTALPLRCVMNHDYQRGQIGSVNLGISELSDGVDAMLIALADMPLLTSADIDHLIDVYSAQHTHQVLVPYCNGQRGNPAIIDFSLRDEILAGGLELGCRRYMDQHPALVMAYETGCTHYVRDIDTPEDYATFKALV